MTDVFKGHVLTPRLRIERQRGAKSKARVLHAPFVKKRQFG